MTVLTKKMSVKIITPFVQKYNKIALLHQ